MVSTGAVVILAGQPAVRPPSRTRSRPRECGGAAETSSQCSSGSIPAGVGSPPGLPLSVRHAPVHCRDTGTSGRYAGFAGPPFSAMPPLLPSAPPIDRYILLLSQLQINSYTN